MAAKQQRGKSKKGNGAGNKKSSQKEFPFKSEIILLILLAVCILLFISNFGLGGAVGAAVSGVFFGTFGLAAYLVPVFLFVGAAFYVSNKRNAIAVVKLAAAILFVLFLCLFIELVVNGSSGQTAAEAYRYGAEHKNGGGFLGGLLAGLLTAAFGLVGAYVVDIIVLIICLVLITERSFLGGVKKGSKKVYDTAREESLRHREQAERRREEKKSRRLDRKVEGVALDTRVLPPKEEPSDNVSELKPVPEAAPFTEKAMRKLFPKEQEASAGAGAGAETEISGGWAKRTADLFRQEGSSPGAAFAGGSRGTADLAGQKGGSLGAVFAGGGRGASDFAGQEGSSPGTEEPQPVVVERVHKKPRQSEAQIHEDVSSIEQEMIHNAQAPAGREYRFPPTSLLKQGNNARGDSQKHLQETAMKLQQTLKNFGVNVTITDVSCGPSVTRYELQPEQGVKVSRIVNLADDIKLNLAAADIRIEAPIPGKAAVGIEVPNKENVMVRFRDMVESPEFQKHSSNICFTVGKDIAGQVVVADIAKMPHLLIAGATGSGKSVCINTIIMSLLYKANPEDVKLILVDPKVVELSVYNGIPHLFIPVVTDPKKAAGALHWAVAEMTERYQKFAEYQVRDLKGYNQKVASIEDIEDETKPQKMPQIVIIVDELADLMMVAPGDVEDAICRLAQLARAAGIHLIIATQRPSVDVITGLIKANMPSRIAFSVSSGVDSRTILDMNGAEKLLGNGDMLFYPQGYQKPLRVQGPFVSDTEVEAVVDFLKKESTVVYNPEIEEKMNQVSSQTGAGAAGGGDERDAYFADAGRFVIEKDKGSIGMLQRWFKIGFNRAARIMDQLEEAGVVGPEEGTKPRRILMSMEQFEEYLAEYV